MELKIKIRSCYDGTRISKPTDFSKSPSLTIQEQTAGQDINNILAKFTRGELMDHVAKHEDEYNDFSNYDYQTQLNKVTRFNQIFEQLPAKTKKKFGNDPVQFLDFIQTQENIEDMKDGTVDNLEKIAEKPAEKPPEKE